MNRVLSLFLKFLIALIVLVIIIYFVITTQIFIKKVILPIAAHQMKGAIAVESIEISPFKSRIAFSDLSLQTEECSAKIKKFECDFNIFSLLSDKISVSNLDLEDSHISLVSKTVQSVNSGKGNGKTRSSASGAAVKMYALDIKDVKVSNFNLKYSVIRDNSASDTITEIKNFNLAIPYLETSGKALAEFSSEITTSTASDTLKGAISGKLNAVLNDKTFPRELLFQSSLNLGKDVSPIYVHFDSTDDAGKTPFELSATLSNLPLQPFFQTFLSGTYKKTNGYINSFDLKANGPDLAQVKTLNGVNGIINLAVSNVYIPADLDNNPIVKLLLLPLDVISKLDAGVSSKVFSVQADNVMDNSSKALSGENIIEFQNGDISALMKNGNTDIKKFLFTGSPRSAIKMVDITGVINKDRTIDLQTKTSISGLLVPLHITGTIENPKPDTVNLVNSMIKNTSSAVRNIIDAASKSGSTNETTKSILNAVDSLTGNSSSGDSSNDDSNSIGSLINNIKSFSK